MQKKNLKIIFYKNQRYFFHFLHTTALKTMYIQKLCNLCIVLIREYFLCSVYLYCKQSLTRSELYYGRDFIYIYHLESLQQCRYLVNFNLFNKCFDGQSHSLPRTKVSGTCLLLAWMINNQSHWCLNNHMIWAFPVHINRHDVGNKQMEDLVTLDLMDTEIQ